jgi:hypothetical protein
MVSTVKNEIHYPLRRPKNKTSVSNLQSCPVSKGFLCKILIFKIVKINLKYY